MGKTRPLPLTAWPVQRATMPREDATVHLGALDLVPADAFEARLAEIDGSRYGGARVRGGRLISPPSPAPARPAAPSTLPDDVRLPPPAMGPADDVAVVSSFRTGALTRLWLALRRWLGR